MVANLVLGLLVVLSASCCAQHGDLRVYQGDLDLRNDFPFAVLLQMAEIPFLRTCSGSLIAENWVLTAGHCIQDIPTVIKYGEFTKSPKSSTSFTKILKSFIHPAYINNLGAIPANDIALILVEKVPDKKHAKLMALDYKSLFGLPVKYAGLGRVTRSIYQLSLHQIMKSQVQPLKVGEGVVLPCAKSVAYKHGPVVCITSKCSKRMQQARPGDSGGPLAYNGRVIGVATSISTFIPISYYTPVSPFLPWITEVMHNNNNTSK